MTLGPPVECGHIFCCFMEQRGTFARKHLLQWKSMTIYKFFRSGHVRDMNVYTVLATCSRVLMAYVKPTQSTPENAHHSYTCRLLSGLMEQGSLFTAGITVHCRDHSSQQVRRRMLTSWGYFNQDVCSVKNGYTAATSSQCSWNQVVQQIKFSTHAVELLFCWQFLCSKSQPGHRHWLLTAKSWLGSFVYTNWPLRTAGRTYKRCSLHWSPTFKNVGNILSPDHEYYY